MLKKFGAIAMLLLLVISFTIGSVEPATVSPTKHVSMKNLDWRGMPGEMDPSMLPGLPALPIPPDGGIQSFAIGATRAGNDGYTSVIIDLSGQGVPVEKRLSWISTGFRPAFGGVYRIPANDQYEGRVIVQKPGSDSANIYPVKFNMHQVPAMMGFGPKISYCTNTVISINDDNSSFLVFNGEIVMLDEGVQNNSMALPAGGYDNEITMGQTVYHQAQVTGESTAFNFDLKWNNPNDKLRLSIYTPDGHVLGPYTDDSDGKTDGRINMEIDNPNGVADGTWLLKVTGTDVMGKEEYYIRTW